MKMNNALSLALVAGLAGTAMAKQGTPQLETNFQPAQITGHIYINAATGERVVTLNGQDDQVSIAAGDVDYWLTMDANPCTVPGTGDDGGSPPTDWDEYGFYSTYADGTAANTTIMMDFGDMPFNSQIAGFAYSYGTDAPDVDGDQIADDRIDSIVYFVDGEDFRQNFSSAGQGMRNVPSAAFWVTELPGDGLWTITLDLTGSTTGSAAYFELGDDDGVLGPLNFSDASMAGVDLDSTTSTIGGAGNADFGWGMYCFHYDEINETASQVTQYALRFLIGAGTGALNNTFVAPQGLGHSDVFFNGEFTGDLDLDLPIHGGIGAYTDANVIPEGTAAGFYYWFGGLDCSTWPGGLPSDPANPFSWGPYAGWRGGLFTSGGADPCLPLDVNGDGTVNFQDVLDFIDAFQLSDPAADLNGDGLINLDDVLYMVDNFAACQG